MKKEEVIMSGFGGQGILLISRLLADAGILEGREVTWFSTYETNIRGGEINCFVILSSERVGCPVVWQPDSVIAISQSALKAFEPTVKPGGRLVVNSSMISQGPAREDLRIVSLPATEMAEEMDNPRIANMIALGAYLRETGVVSLGSVGRSLERILPQRHHALIPLNEAALRLGFDFSSKGG